ncbi:MAG: toxin [Candidatus Omnitrophica bacterium]|nr:toxin [Candidatus Omnitrophota bacterium]
MVVWDDKKDLKLKIERDISFEDISDIVLHNQYLDILEHPIKKNQNIFVIELNNYIYAVPFVIDTGSNIILKTIYPSRKLYKKYRGGKKCKKK